MRCDQYFGVFEGVTAAGEIKREFFKFFRLGRPIFPKMNNTFSELQRKWQQKLLFTNGEEVVHVCTALQNYGTFMCLGSACQTGRDTKKSLSKLCTAYLSS